MGGYRYGKLRCFQERDDWCCSSLALYDSHISSLSFQFAIGNWEEIRMFDETIP